MLSVAGAIPIRMGVLDGVCDLRHAGAGRCVRAYDQGISELLFGTSCISRSCQPLGVVFRQPADPRFTKPDGPVNHPESAGRFEARCFDLTAAGRESWGLTER